MKSQINFFKYKLFLLEGHKVHFIPLRGANNKYIVQLGRKNCILRM